MIQDLLVKEKIQDQKPRFFLHDEVKTWLADNLSIKVNVTANMSTDYRLANFGIPQIPIMYTITVTSFIDNKPIGDTGYLKIDLYDYQNAFIQLADRLNYCTLATYNLQAENQELKKRIELLENPLPV